MAWDTRITSDAAHFLRASAASPHPSCYQWSCGQQHHRCLSLPVQHRAQKLRKGVTLKHRQDSGVALTLRIRKQITGDGNAANCPSGDAMCCVMMGPGSHVTAIPSSSPLQWPPWCCLLRLMWHPALCEDASYQAPEIISLFASLG